MRKLTPINTLNDNMLCYCLILKFLKYFREEIQTFTYLWPGKYSWDSSHYYQTVISGFFLFHCVKPELMKQGKFYVFCEDNQNAWNLFFLVSYKYKKVLIIKMLGFLFSYYVINRKFSRTLYFNDFHWLRIYLCLSQTESLYGTAILCDFYNCTCFCLLQCAFIKCLSRYLSGFERSLMSKEIYRRTHWHQVSV